MADASGSIEVVPRRALPVPALGWWALAAAVICAGAEVMSGLGYRWNWWALGTGLQALRWSASAALFAAVVALLALVLAIRARSPRAMLPGTAALLLALAVAGPPAYLWRQAQHLPRIHDASTS